MSKATMGSTLEEARAFKDTLILLTKEHPVTFSHRMTTWNPRFGFVSSGNNPVHIYEVESVVESIFSKLEDHCITDGYDPSCILEYFKEDVRDYLLGLEKMYKCSVPNKLLDTCGFFDDSDHDSDHDFDIEPRPLAVPCADQSSVIASGVQENLSSDFRGVPAPGGA